MHCTARKVEKTALHVRWMMPCDMPHVLDMEFEGFEFPWTQLDFLRILRLPDCRGQVAEVAGQRAGYMVYEVNARRIRLLNFCVGHDWRRRGVGAAMVAKLRSIQGNRPTRIVTECRESNLPAQLFFRSQGFRAVEVLRGFYSNKEDAFKFVWGGKS
jgi:[ribosomal protein S18]-alanine N-acetyltransferase